MSDQPRVLIITNLYPRPDQPGRASFNRQQFQTLAELTPVRLIVPIAWTESFPKTASREPSRPLVDYVRYWYTPGCFRSTYGFTLDQSIRRTVQRVSETFHPDVVLGSWAYPDGWAAVKAARRIQKPAVVKIHGSDVHELKYHPSRRRGTIQALQKADRIVSISKNLAEQAAALGVSPDKIRVVPNGVDSKLFHPGSREDARAKLKRRPTQPTILAVGNLVPVKQINLLIQAFTDPRFRSRDARLVIVGKGPLESTLKSEADRLGVAGEVEFVGSVPHHELPVWFQAADVVALTSRNEGIPNVLLEASACGIPWVATHVGGIPEIVRGPRHRTFPNGDVSALADSLVQALDDGPDPNPPSFLDWKDSANRLLEVLQEVSRRTPTET